MGLFDKKYCDICGEKISFLGNRKLDDGNMCSKCAKLISPFMTDRRHTTISEMKEHLKYREDNKRLLDAFSPGEAYGDGDKVYIDRAKGTFVISCYSPGSWEKENPDVIPISEVCSCNLDIKENRTEEFMKDSQGNSKSYSPPRYTYDYDFYVKIGLSSRWFSDIQVKLNLMDVEGLNSQKYHDYQMMGMQIVSALTGTPMNISTGTGYGVAGAFGGIGGMANAFVNQVAQNAARQQETFNAESEIERGKRQALEQLQTNGVSENVQLICPNCKKPADGRFCPDCGSELQMPIRISCAKCGQDIEMKGVIPRFCPACGDKIDIDDMIL